MTSLPKSKLVRKASPPRAEAEDTFKRKLDEIKQLRQKQTNIGLKIPKIIVNGKPALDVQGDWALFSSASSGKQYYFNLKTLVNQWTKPSGWILKVGQKAPAPPRAPPPPPPNPSEPRPPAPPQVPAPPDPTNGNGSNSNKNGNQKKTSGFKMKIKKGSKVKKKKKSVVPEDPTLKIPKAYLEFSDDEDEKSAKLPKFDDDDYSNSSSSRSSSKSPEVSKSPPKPFFPPVSSAPLIPEMNPIIQAAILAAKAKIESQLPLESMMSGGSMMTTSLMSMTSMTSSTNNPSWLSEYNFPALLSRCKFPKTQDALHELSTNRSKKRVEPNLPPLPPEVAQFVTSGSQFDVRRDMFAAELKHSNNRHRLLTEKLNGITVYKIPDELWERSFPMFNVELLGPNIKLECRPHGFTEDNVPVYTRTGKIAAKIPYPEDIVRCHAVVQAWKTETCHCVYANKTYTIERDDRQWKRDLEESKKFLIENGY